MQVKFQKFILGWKLFTFFIYNINNNQTNYALLAWNTVYKKKRFSDHSPLIVDYDFELAEDWSHHGWHTGNFVEVKKWNFTDIELGYHLPLGKRSGLTAYMIYRNDPNNLAEKTARGRYGSMVSFSARF